MPRGKKRRSAWGSIASAGDGVWRLRYWGKDSSGQYRRRSETVRGTRKDAERRRAELMLEHSEDAPCPTVGQAWERWAWPDMERRFGDGDVSRNTMRQYRSAWARHVAPTWADVPLDAVRPLAVQQWLYGLGRTQAEQGTKLLSKVMDYAVRYEVVPYNPMRERYVMPSKSTVGAQDAGVWSLAELGPLWASLRGQWFEPAFILAAFGGLRVGESLGPMASEVGLRDVGGVPVAMVPVVRQVGASGEATGRLKTPQSERTAVIAGRAALRLAELAGATPAGWPLTNDGLGGWQSQRRLARAWEALGAEHPFRNLRNSWQTWMRWELRVPPYLIEPMMGHRVAGVTGAHYDRPAADMFAEVVADAYRARPWDADWAL